MSAMTALSGSRDIFANHDPEVVKLRSIVGANLTSKSSGWDEAWQAGATAWDGGEAQPPLRELIESNAVDFAAAGRALVPGCGRAYDAIYIASKLGMTTLGYDISPTALEAANKQLSMFPELRASGKISFELGDFFAISPPEDEKFDLVYDYTFFVAIPPSMRDSWGRQMSTLVKPGGYLITLVYPLGLKPDGQGPPYHVLPEHYVGPLGGNFTRVYDEIPTTKAASPYDGDSQMIVWRRK